MYHQKRYCACGSTIRLRDSVCKDCREKYGNKSSEWPDWMLYLVKQEQREIDRQRLHDFDRFIPIDFGVTNDDTVF